MFVKKVKRKCNVRGCKSTDCFAISRVREVGNTVIICKSCLGKALGAVDEVNPETKSNIPVNNAPAPALFYNAQALGLNIDSDVNDETKSTPPADEFICPKCGRAFDSEKGLNTHLRYCKGQSEE